MFHTYQINIAIPAILLMTLKVSAGPKAYFFSGSAEDCAKDKWDGDLAKLGSKGYSMDNGCIKHQLSDDPTVGPRMFVYTPSAKKARNFCLVMSPTDGCKGDNGCMEGLKMDLTLDGKSPTVCTLGILSGR